MISALSDESKGLCLYFDEKSVVPVWIKHLIQTGKKPLLCNPMKIGGDGFSIFLCLRNKDARIELLKKKRGKRETQNCVMNRQQKIEILIRAAERAYQRGPSRSLSSDPTPGEQLGIQVNVLRRMQQKSLSWMSEKTGYQPDELTAFEAGILSNQKMLEMFPKIIIALESTIIERSLALSRFPSVS